MEALRNSENVEPERVVLSCRGVVEDTQPSSRLGKSFLARISAGGANVRDT